SSSRRRVSRDEAKGRRGEGETRRGGTRGRREFSFGDHSPTCPFSPLRVSASPILRVPASLLYASPRLSSPRPASLLFAPLRPFAHSPLLSSTRRVSVYLAFIGATSL